MMPIWSRLVAVLAICSLVGCATVMNGGPDMVPVNTNPAGAQVILNGQFVGYTPTVIRLDRDRPAHIQLLLQGFQPVVLSRDKHFNGWFIGSILLLYLIFPIIVDVATGNIMQYGDEGIAVGMTPLYPQPYPQQPGYPPAQPQQGYPPAQPPPMQPPQQPYPPAQPPPR